MTGAASARPTSKAAIGGDREAQRSLRVLFSSVFVVMTGYGITLTVLPYYAERVHGLNGVDQSTITLHVGVLTSVYAFAQLIASPIVGRIGDRVGRRPVLLAGLAGMAVTQAAFGFVPQLWALYGLRILGGIATSGMLVAATTYVADTTADGERTRGMAWFGTAVSLGLVAGPALGGVLSRPGVSIGRGAWRLDGYSLPFLVAGTLAFAVLVAAVRGLPESMMASRATRGTGADCPTSEPEPHPGLRPLLALVVASQFGLAVFEGSFALYARNSLALSPARTSAAFMVCGVVMAALQVFAVGALGRLVHPLVQVAAGLAFMGFGIGALVTTRDYGLVLVFVAVLALGTALITPNLSALISNHNRYGVGTSLGLKSSAGSMGQTAGPLFGAFLMSWRQDSPFVIAAALLLGLAAVVMSIKRPAARPADASDLDS